MIHISSHAVQQACNRLNISPDSILSAVLSAENLEITDGEYQNDEIRLVIKPPRPGYRSPVVVTVTEPRGTGRYRSDSWSSSS